MLVSSLLLVACGPENTSSPTPDPSTEPSVEASVTPEPTLAPLPSNAPTASPSADTSATPEPTGTPGPTPTPEPTPLPTALPDTASNTLGMTFVRIPAGTYTQGSPTTETGRDSDETQRQVTLTRDFLMQTTEVTQAQWKAVMGTNPAKHQEPANTARPVENVSYDDILTFISKLNAQTEQSYRLPTEAEWEYAARAGSQQAFTFGSNPRFLTQYSWYTANESDPPSTQPVAQKTVNKFGLYDVHGNVAELVADFYAANRSSASATDPTGPSNSSLRLHKGGHFQSVESDLRLAGRQLIRPDTREGMVGFRLVLN